MKAKHFTNGVKQEIVLETGKSFKALPGETQSTFADRIVAKIQDEELDELEISLINKAKLETVSNERAEDLFKKAHGLEKEMLEDLLASRGISIQGDENSSITDKSNSNQNSETMADQEVVKGKVKGKVAVKNTDAEVKPAMAAVKDDAPAKEKKEKVAPMTPKEREEAIAAFKASKEYTGPESNKGKEVIYSTKNTKNGKGVIKSLSINKTLSKVYYTVQNTETKKRECVSLANVEFVK